MKSHTFLVVDRDPLMREILRDTLDYAGAKTFCASDIKGALEIIEEHPIDVMITEYRLHFGTGLELIRRLENCGLHIPTALMLSSDLDVSLDTAFASGAKIVFMKPFGLNDFLDGMRLLIAPELSREQKDHWEIKPRLLSL